MHYYESVFDEEFVKCFMCDQEVIKEDALFVGEQYFCSPNCVDKTGQIEPLYEALFNQEAMFCGDKLWFNHEFQNGHCTHCGLNEQVYNEYEDRIDQAIDEERLSHD